MQKPPKLRDCVFYSTDSKRNINMPKFSHWNNWKIKNKEKYGIQIKKRERKKKENEENCLTCLKNFHIPDV